jgi:feruloyl esterase
MNTPAKTFLALALVIVMNSAVAAAAHAPVSCESLASVALPHVTVVSAKTVAAGDFAPPAGGRGPAVAWKALPAFCRIQATLQPAGDSGIRIEVWMPASGWNNKLQSVGNGAWAGVIVYPALATALAQGYAAASTDTGHTGNDPSFIPGHPGKLIDFGYRGVHEMTVAAKNIIAAFYGESPRLSYFNGCSTGGRQAMVEVQRYPADYDGVIAGDPVFDSSRIQGTQLWLWQIFHQDEASNFPAEKLTLLHNAVIKSCDGLDGVKDGVLEDPTRCGFDPAELKCKNGDAPTCLTAPQVEAARQSYIGPVNPRTGQPVWPGREWGSELGWVNHSGSVPSTYASDLYRYVVFQDPQWDYRNFDFDRDVVLAQKAMKDTMDSVDPDLRPFFEHGGKLIQYHGWNDPGVAPQGSVNYYRAVAAKMGGMGRVNDKYRLFMVPGMGHCGGGDGTSTFNMISALEQWVEDGKAPDWIPASRVRNGAVDRTRPLCPYPQVAAYKGSGNTDDAANFVCRVP